MDNILMSRNGPPRWNVLFTSNY